MIHYKRLIRKGRFDSTEPEFPLLDRYIKPGDWCLDIGAGIGKYSCRMSALAGPEGRVLAFEPADENFAILTANARHFPFRNVSLINLAVSERQTRVELRTPLRPSGLLAYGLTRIVPENALPPDNEVISHSLAIAIDSLALENPITFIKIDVEGHELDVLKGMKQTLARYHPVVLVEINDPTVSTFMNDSGYTGSRKEGSPNILFIPLNSYI